MRLLTELIAGTTTTAAGDSGAGLDPLWLIGIPAALLASIGVYTYFVGMIRPLSIKRPTYWQADKTTHFSCAVKNRSFLRETTLTSLSLVRAPGLLKRTLSPRWKKRAQTADLIPWGVKLPTDPVSKRNEVTLQGELRKINATGVFDPNPGSRLLAHAGSKTSRSKRLMRVKKP